MTSPDQNFKEVRDFLIDRINQAKAPDTRALPSENQLADYFNLPRSTIRRVYQQLLELGYVESHHGVGHFARQPLPQINLVMRGDQSFSEKMKEQQLNYDAKQLPLKWDSDVYYFSRLRLIDGIPVAIHTSTIARQLFPNFLTEIQNETSLFRYLREKGHRHFYSSFCRMQVIIPAQEEQELLSCGSLVPLVQLESDCIDQDSHTKLEESRVVYRSDIVRFNLK